MDTPHPDLAAAQKTPDVELALGGSLHDFLERVGPDLQAKSEAFYEWARLRRDQGLQPYVRHLLAPPGPQTHLHQADGQALQGLNLASQDYLALASHPQVISAVQDAASRFGVHSAGSTVLSGNVGEAIALEAELAEFVDMPHCLLYPTGWAAGYGVMRALVRPRDHVVMDQLAHNCLQEGARASTGHVHLHRHLDVAHARRLLERIRRQDPHAGILLVTEGCFSMDADSPDLPALQELAKQTGALLLVDVAHDLGALGPLGQGQLGLQGLHGQADLVLGAFSKTFASNGGFVACRTPALKEYLRFYSPSNAFSNALSPLQIAAIRCCLTLVQSDEGQSRRDMLMQTVTLARHHLALEGLEVMGQPCPIVPVKLGSPAIARLTVRHLAEQGVLVNLVEYPAVARHESRIRLQWMVGHNATDALIAAKHIAQSVHHAQQLRPLHGHAATQKPPTDSRSSLAATASTAAPPGQPRGVAALSQTQPIDPGG